MSKLRKIHFVIHNQGLYDHDKKQQLLDLLQSKYSTNLEGYLIAQESYKHDSSDSHLQGNLFFKNAIHFKAILKLFKSKYIEISTPEGLKHRTDISAVLHEGRAYNYMVNPHKDGGDPFPISDCTALDSRRQNLLLTKELNIVINETIEMVRRRKYQRYLTNYDGIGDPLLYSSFWDCVQIPAII